MPKRSFLEKILFPTKRVSLTSLRQAVQGKTILITGASFGIGEELTRLLAQFDCQLILVARTKEKLIQIEQDLSDLPAKITFFSGDLRVEKEMNDFLNYLKSFNVDFFISNAGISIKRSLKNSLDRMHDFQRTMAINYFAPVQISLALIPNLKKQGGQIINVSALNVLLPPMPGWSAYQSSKTAFDQWCRSNAPELKSQNIDLTTVYLPLVRTRMIAPNESYNNTPAMQPEEVAKLIAKLMVSRKKMFKPWWLRPTEFFAFILRRPVRYFVFKKSKNV